jgi:hypothetical protein
MGFLRRVRIYLGSERRKVVFKVLLNPVLLHTFLQILDVLFTLLKNFAVPFVYGFDFTGWLVNQR